MKKLILLSSALLSVVFLAGCGTQPTTPAPAAQQKEQPVATQQPAAADETADWKTYKNDKYGFSFTYPVTWKMVTVSQASSVDFLPGSRNFVAIYPEKYPAQDFSARVDVYDVSLATVKRDSPFLKNLSSSAQTINGISWVKMGDTDYLVEKNGKTYDISGRGDLIIQIVSTFKFTNASTTNNEPLSYSTTGVSVSASKTTAPFDYTADQLKSLAEECGTQQKIGYFEKLVAKFSGTTKTVYNFEYQGDSQDSGVYSVTLLPNKAGYKSLGEFKKDFDLCLAGGDAYPVMLNDTWLLFAKSCSSGFDDDSGKPHGCEEVQKIVGPSLKLN